MSSEIENISYEPRSSEISEIVELVLPIGYDIIDGNLIMIKTDLRTGAAYNEIICHSPITLTGVSQDIDTDEISYEVSFTDSLGHNHKEMYKQEELIIPPKLKQTTLGSKINLIDSKINILCQYFNQAIKEKAQELPRNITVSKYGWRQDDSFVVGNK